jgi:hypothetical protein
MHQEMTISDKSKSFLGARCQAVIAWLWLLIAVPFVSEPHHNLFAMLFLGASGFCIGMTWVLYSVTWPQFLSQPSRKWWLSIPLAGSLGVALLFSNYGLALRIMLCENSLREYIATVPPGQPADGKVQWIGLFRVEEVTEYQGAVYFYTGAGFLDRSGLAYIPPGLLPTPKIRVHHLYGPWYTFVWRF